MGDQREIIKLVWKQLGEIDKLKGEKGSEPLNSARSAYLQRCICRKYVMIEFLISLIENPMSKMRIQTVVGLKKEEDGAEIKDLKAMPIPKLVTAQKVKDWLEVKEEETTLGPFPYLYLPPEVRQTILGYLTNPADQLNLAKAIPADAAMMEWFMNSLRLELILPIVFNRTDLGYQEAVNLCHASVELHDVVKNCFGRILADPLAAEHNFRRRCKSVDEVAPADYGLSPLPSPVDLLYEFDDARPNDHDYEEWKLKQLGILRQFGNNVWSFHLSVLGATSTRKMIQLVRDCVDLMPNLRNLAVFIDLSDRRWSPLEEEQIRNVRFPELPYLKHLELLGWGFLEEYYAKLLDKYRSGIMYLEVEHFWDLPIISTEETMYPRLTHLNAFDIVTEDEGIADKVTRLNTFAGSPLKTIVFRGGYHENKVEEFVSLLSTFGQFGETLEHLSIQFASTSKKDSGGDKESADLSQLANLNFPKVKTLEVRGYPSTWIFLLNFPALETLKLNLSDIDYSDEHPSRYFDSTDILDLSFVKEELYTARIWKMLPLLKSINIFQGNGNNDKNEQVTRSQCLVYQRKLAEIQELMEQADITIEGSVNKVLQPSDTTFAVEGDVNGNVVQQGNGIILVTGKVCGKIEQKGKGRIFVRGKHLGALSKTGNGIVEVDWGNIKN